MEVATVCASSPQEVVALTQIIADDDDWFQSRNKPGIRLSKAAHSQKGQGSWLRSTQLGDVLVLNSTSTYAASSSLALLVDANGFSLLPDCTPIDVNVLFPPCFPTHLD